jgi:hypothetical protein
MIQFKKIQVAVVLLIVLIGANACEKPNEWGQSIPVVSSCQISSGSILVKNRLTKNQSTDVITFSEQGVTLKYDDTSAERLNIAWSDVQMVYLFKSPNEGTFMSIMNKKEEWFAIAYFNSNCEKEIDNVLPRNIPTTHH